MERRPPVVLHRRQSLEEIDACFRQGLGAECDVVKHKGVWRLGRPETTAASLPSLRDVLDLRRRNHFLVLDLKSPFEDVFPRHPNVWLIQTAAGPEQPQATSPSRTKWQLLAYALFRRPLRGAHILPAMTDRVPRGMKLYETLRHPRLVAIPYITSNGYVPPSFLATSPYVLVHEKCPELALAIADKLKEHD